MNIRKNKIGIIKIELYINNFKLVKPAVQQTTNEMNRLENATNSVKITANNTGDRISKAFSRGLRSVRRLTLGFLGARSAFSLFRKYFNQYSAENDLFRQIGIDPNTISPGTRLLKKDVDKVFALTLKEIRDSIESRLASNNITLNNNQILSLVAFEHNGGATASNNVINSYKQNGNSYKLYSEYCNYVHGTYMGQSGYLYPGLILRRKVEWLIWTSGIYLPTDTDQSYDNNTECVGNFAVPNDKKSLVTPLLEETAKQFGGTISYF